MTTIQAIKTSIGLIQVLDIAASKFGPCIGTRVKLSPTQFCQEIVPEAFESHDVSKDHAPGQHFVMLNPLSAMNLQQIFISGVGRRTDNPWDYFPATWRGRVELFGRRRLALEVTGAAVILYTREAFRNDPEVTEEQKSWLLRDTEYVLVDVLAFNGPASPPTPERFVSNLGGGNNAYTPRAIVERLASEGPITDFSNTYTSGAYDAVLFLNAEALKTHVYWSQHVVVGDEDW